MFTDEQLKVILGMPDFGEEEEGLQRQYQMANQLRQLGMGEGGTRRMDWASQVARGIGGLGGGYFQNKAESRSRDISDQRRRALENIFRNPGMSPDLP